MDGSILRMQMGRMESPFCKGQGRNLTEIVGFYRGWPN